MSNQLQRKLLEQVEDATLIEYSSKEWRSPTFSGNKHTLRLEFTDPDCASTFIKNVEDEKLTVNLTGNLLLCDLSILDRHQLIVVVEALTLNS
jgi:hypothetical protein